MDLRTTITKTLLGEQIEQLQESSKYEPDLEDMGRSQLWHAHAEAHEHSIHGRPTASHKKLAQKIHAYVAATHGREMADDMQKHSEHQTKYFNASGLERSGASPHIPVMSDLRKKHKIKAGGAYGYNW